MKYGKTKTKSLLCAVAIAGATLNMTSCMNKNPFFSEYNTPHETAPFNKIKLEHYEPALMEGIKQHQAEVDAIINNPEVPTFENTIVALEYAGDLLDRVTTVFFTLNSAETSDEMQALAQKLSPVLTEHSNNISLNEKLFARVKAVYETTDKSKLNTEQQRLLQKSYDGFARNGANLSDEDKAKYRELTTELSMTTLAFSQNMLKATNEYTLNVTDSTRLKGLPESALEAAAQTAKEKGQDGWTFTLHAPSYSPLMMYCEDRDLRRELYMAYNTQNVQNNEYNNEENVKKIVNLRLAIAQLLGYECHADYILENRSMLEASVEGREGSEVHALNEITVHRNGAAMLAVEVTIDGVALPAYWADGLIVSTSSGSTSYSLIAGGPIVLPESKVLIITPISPHNLKVRPLVVPDGSSISLKVSSRDGEVIFTADNRSGIVQDGAVVNISLAQFSLKRVRLNKSDFINALTEKLFWGEDVRNIK